MNKIDFDRSGGAKVHFKKPQRKMLKSIIFLITAFFLYSTTVFAQGSIFGAVANSDATTPANGEISFFGFLDDTDEEIRIETCVGAGYDAGNWFDDFQNYLTEAPGNPYDYYFYNGVNGEGAVLSKLIPNNSFQQEDITLASITWPAKPSGLAGQVISSSSAVISWNSLPGLTWHVYRRMASSSGSFFRIDDPSGSLANPGVADSFFVDGTVDGASSYSYLITAEDASGNLSPHSDVITVNSAIAEVPVATAITPDSGSVVGGTAVTVSGAGFDGSGVVVNIGAGTLSSVVVISPFEITGLTPPTAAGAVDISVTNVASGLTSAPLVAGYNYIPNMPPVLDPIGPQATTEGINLNFAVTASDPDGTTPTLFTSALPGTAIFTDNGGGSGTFDWTPTFTESGVYPVTFFAADGIDTVSELVNITVTDAGNQPPVLDSIGPKAVAEANNLNFIITSSDPDETTPSLSATGLPATNASFVDNLDGTGTFDFNPDFTQTGTYSVTFKAFDGIVVDSEVVQIDVTETNQPPILAAIGSQVTDEGVSLNFGVTATDGDSEPITLYTSALPGAANFLDNGDGTGSFDWIPGFNESGSYDVTFYASDTKDIDSELVTITVNDAGNQPPVLDSIRPLAVTEGDQLIKNITASDPDGDVLQLFADSLPLNASFVDSGNGVGTFTFDPDFAQSGVYNVLFSASDGALADSELVAVTVNETGNQAPVLSAPGDTVINEGDSLVLVVTGSDPDGAGIQLTVSSTLEGFSFIDSGNGVGVFSYYAGYFDAAVDSIWFTAVDQEIPPAVATQGMELTIVDVNQPPVIDSIGPFGVAIDDALVFTITASDSTDPDPSRTLLLAAVGLPANASFTDNGNNTGGFTFTPDSTQVGVFSVTFIATDRGTPQLTGQLVVSIIVVQENRPPELDVGSAFTVWEGETLNFPFSATDPDGTVPWFEVSSMPENSGYTDNGDGTGSFTFSPGYVQAGLYGIVVKAKDGIAITKANVLIQVYEAGNQAPFVNPTPPDTVVEGNSLVMTVSAGDPDGTIPALSADSLPENATFTDSGDGTGTIGFYPSYIQNGTHSVYIIATDGEYADTSVVTIFVEEAGNQRPVLAPVSDKTLNEMETLTFTVTSSDPDMNTTNLSTEGLPGSATFTDNRDFTGTFNWVTDNFDAGTYSVKFVASDSLDATLRDSIFVNITVENVNQLPRFGYMETSYTINEGDNLIINIVTFDPDNTIPLVTVNSPDYELVENMSFVDNEDGTGTFTFAPDYTQGGPGPKEYYMQWKALDSEDNTLYSLSYNIKISVYDVNQPPEITVIVDDLEYVQDTLALDVTEGDTLEFTVMADDADGDPVYGPFVLNLPNNAFYSGLLPNIKDFAFYPDYMQAGFYEVLFTASDAENTDTCVVNITVLEAGNRSPALTMTLPANQAAVANQTLTNVLTAEDPDLDSIIIRSDTIPPGAAFVDSGNGVAVFTISPQIIDVGDSYTVTFTVEDLSGAADTIITQYTVVETVRGDVNSDSDLNLLDIMFLINYLYKGGPAPTSKAAADVNFDENINLLDATYLLNYLYKQGPAPPGF